ncbi:MAG: dihydrolipoyllysine-residue succinyltransferase, partial [Rhodanobacteraceae bacterium]
LTTEETLDPAKIKATGKGGRLTKSDVVAHLKETPAAKAAPTDDQEKPRAAKKSPVEQQPSAGESSERFTRKKMSPLRRKIAAQLVMAQQTAAILTTFNECDMTEVMTLRKKAQEKFQADHGVKLGFMSFFLKATVEALKAVPSINSRIEGDDFILNHYYDIGVAVGTERGLVVPVVREVDQKSFADLERDIVDFATRARDGKIKIEDLQGGVFTISNGGVYGSLMGTPILNPPQSGILGMHTIQQRPVAITGEVVVRPMMYLALSYDHRAVDGKEAVTFLIKVKEAIENPTGLLLDL